jgi:hypothetical protein
MHVIMPQQYTDNPTCSNLGVILLYYGNYTKLVLKTYNTRHIQGLDYIKTDHE